MVASFGPGKDKVAAVAHSLKSTPGPVAVGLSGGLFGEFIFGTVESVVDFDASAEHFTVTFRPNALYCARLGSSRVWNLGKKQEIHIPRYGLNVGNVLVAVRHGEEAALHAERIASSVTGATTALS